MPLGWRHIASNSPPVVVLPRWVAAVRSSRCQDLHLGPVTDHQRLYEIDWVVTHNRSNINHRTNTNRTYTILMCYRFYVNFTQSCAIFLNEKIGAYISLHIYRRIICLIWFEDAYHVHLLQENKQSCQCKRKGRAKYQPIPGNHDTQHRLLYWNYYEWVLDATEAVAIL